MKPLIKKLVEAYGPSGYESQVRDLVRLEVEAYADEIRVDALGNLIVRKGNPSPEGKTIMLAGHMDELGVMVTHVDEKGFLRFTTIGGVYPQNCLGGRVRFIQGIEGVIGAEQLEGRDKLATFDKMYIDVGATSRETCPVKVGDVAAFDRPFVDLGERLVSKAMDDRIGVAVMVSALQQLKSTPHQLYFVFTVQEEVGLRGATTAAFGVNPDLGVAVDVTLVGDTPKGIKMDVALGKGPAVKVRDDYLIVDPRLVDWMASTAAKANIPYQYEVLVGGGTDAAAINLTRAGAPSTCLSIPTRYIHSPSEMVDYNDVQNAVRLLVELLSNPVQLK
ncbi:MAG: M42 family metallopeptidase [Chloroflexi bacterium]|nr:M42 family metallopeptidase [Chloroflexota bacterium]